MFGAIAGGIASALAGGAMSKLFGGGQKAASGGIQGRSEERFSRNAETDLVCRLLLGKKRVTLCPAANCRERRPTDALYPCSMPTFLASCSGFQMVTTPEQQLVCRWSFNISRVACVFV